MERKRDSGELPQQKAKRQNQITDARKVNSNVPQIHEKLDNLPITVHRETSGAVNALDAVSPERLQALIEEEIAELGFEEDWLSTQVKDAQTAVDKVYEEEVRRFLEE